MRESTLNFFYEEGRAATRMIVIADNQFVEARKQYKVLLKALGRRRHIKTYAAFLQGYLDELRANGRATKSQHISARSLNNGKDELKV